MSQMVASGIEIVPPPQACVSKDENVAETERQVSEADIVAGNMLGFSTAAVKTEKCAISTSEATNSSAQLNPSNNINALDALNNFDFWTEEEHNRFVSAIDGPTFPPDYSIVSVHMGSKSPDQCRSYGRFYFDALQALRDACGSGPAAAELVKRVPTAHDVYSFLNIAAAYEAFLRRRQPPSVPRGAAPPPAGGHVDSFDARSAAGGVGSGKSSIDFLCGPGAGGVSGDGGGAAASDGEEDGAGAGGRRSASAKAGEEVGRNGGVKQDGVDSDSGTAGRLSRQGGGSKRRREDTPTEMKEEEVDQGLVPPEEMWSYAAMQDGAVVKEEMEQEQAAAREAAAVTASNSRDAGGREWKAIMEERPGQRWGWTRKNMGKGSSYNNWWPLFAEYTTLSKRDAGDDLRLIKQRAPPPAPPVIENPYSRKTGTVKEEERSSSSRPNNPKRELNDWLQVGCFVEVKWDRDWWHASIKKVKLERGSDRVDKVYVSYVGGTSSDDEWVPAIASRVRAPREDVSKKEVVARKDVAVAASGTTGAKRESTGGNKRESSGGTRREPSRRSADTSSNTRSTTRRPAKRR